MDAHTRMVRDLEARLRPGFTLIELVIVILIGGLLAALAVPPLGAYVEGRNRVQARDAFMMVAARARAAAVEEGDFVLMTISSTGDSVVVTSQRDGAMIDVLRLYSGARKADIVGDGEFTVCYSPRGFAHPSCQDGADLPHLVGFASGGGTAWARLTLGQVEVQ